MDICSSLSVDFYDEALLQNLETGVLTIHKYIIFGFVEVCFSLSVNNKQACMKHTQTYVCMQIYIYMYIILKNSTGSHI